MIPSCAVLVIKKSVHFTGRQSPFPLDVDVFSHLTFKDLVEWLNVPDRMRACSIFRDMNKTNCLLICRIPYLIKTPATDMGTCWAAAC